MGPTPHPIGHVAIVAIAAAGGGLLRVRRGAGGARRVRVVGVVHGVGPVGIANRDGHTRAAARHPAWHTESPLKGRGAYSQKTWHFVPANLCVRRTRRP